MSNSTITEDIVCFNTVTLILVQPIVNLTHSSIALGYGFMFMASTPFCLSFHSAFSSANKTTKTKHFIYSSQ
uniref:Uncharacterized protein n=1 Tax=Moniliophthora roreri TaxID=221103 RepID=A0A0W0GD22_MONRR